jgi:hypothetical protein
MAELVEIFERDELIFLHAKVARAFHLFTSAVRVEAAPFLSDIPIHNLPKFYAPDVNVATIAELRLRVTEALQIFTETIAVVGARLPKPTQTSLRLVNDKRFNNLRIVEALRVFMEVKRTAHAPTHYMFAIGNLLCGCAPDLKIFKSKGFTS